MTPDDWNYRTISPKRQTPPKMDIRDPCPGICRFFGMVSFVTVVLTIYNAGTALLGIPRLDWVAPVWTAKHLMLVVSAVAVGMVASVFGFGLGVLIRVRNERINHLCIVLWQFLANGSLLWVMTIGIAMSISLGKDEAKAAVLQFGAERASLHVVATGSIVGLLLGFMFFLAPFVRLPVLGYLALAVSISLAAAKWHFQVYGIQGHSWIGAGIAFPVGLLLYSSAMIARDHQQRRLAKEQTE